MYIQIIDKYIWIFLTTLHFNLYKIEIVFDSEVDVYVSIFPLFAFTYSFSVCCVLLINFWISIDCSGLSVWLSVRCFQFYSFILRHFYFFLLKSCELCTQTIVPCFWCRFKVNTLDGMRNSEKVGVCSEQSENSYKWEICVLLSLHFPSLCRMCWTFHVSIELDFSIKHIAFLEEYKRWLIRKIFHSNWNRLIKGLMFSQQLDRKWTEKKATLLENAFNFFRIINDRFYILAIWRYLLVPFCF